MVQIINQYGDFKVYIEAIATEIRGLEVNLGKEESIHKELNKHLRTLKQTLLATGERRQHVAAELDKLRVFIAQTQTWIDERTAELENDEEVHASVLKERDLYVQEHKAN